MHIYVKLFFVIGATLALIGIAFGAFGSHALKNRLTTDALSIFEVGVRYQMYHALGLMMIAGAISYFASPWLLWSGWILTLGTLLFSGSLYLLTLSGVKSWGIVTPIGGLFLLMGWFLAIMGAIFSR